MFARAYQFIQNLSLDIVGGALILLHFFSLRLQVNPNWETYVLLGIAVWFIYTLDHLDDAKKAKIGTRKRYAFHAKYSKYLKIAIVLLAILCVYCLTQIPTLILFYGIIFVGLSFFYLLFQRKIAKYGLKEIYVAVIYTSGILLVPFVLSNQFLVIDFLVLFIISYTNLLIFSLFDTEQDKSDGFTSTSIVWGREKTEKIILALLSIGFALSVLGIDKYAYFLYYLLVIFLYALMILRQPAFQTNAFYRIVGDGVFLLPILFMDCLR